MNIRRKNESGCELVIEHFAFICTNSSFTVQVIEKLIGNGYRNGSKDKKSYAERLQREDFWIKTYRTVYPYGLNEKKKPGVYLLLHCYNHCPVMVFSRIFEYALKLEYSNK